MKKHYLLAILLLPLCFTACKKDGISQNPEPESKRETVTYKLKNGGQVTVFINKKGEYIVGGDVILSSQQIAFLNENKVNATGVSTESTFTNEFQKLWPNGIVYYTINDASNSARIQEAINHWEANTPIRFVQRTNQDNYVYFGGRPDKGAGDSQLGMVGGAQAIRLEENAGLRTAVHEIGHAVGLMHEHTRNDRDNYVNINYSNISGNWGDQYDTYDTQGLGGYQTGPFDFESVMLYSSYSAGVGYPGNTTPQITKKDGSTYNYNYIGKLSQGDINGIKSLYRVVYYKKTMTTEAYENDNDHTFIREINFINLYEDEACTIPYVLTKKLKATVYYTYSTLGLRPEYSSAYGPLILNPGSSSYVVGANNTDVRYDYGTDYGHINTSNLVSIEGSYVFKGGY